MDQILINSRECVCSMSLTDQISDLLYGKGLIKTYYIRIKLFIKRKKILFIVIYDRFVYSYSLDLM